MSINGVLGNALTGLLASQTGMRNASNNIANINTPGYARTEVHYGARVTAGVGSGVDVETIRRVVDDFLVATALRTAGERAGAETLAEGLDRIQSQFGAPDDPGSIFARLESAFAEIGAAAANPSSSVSRDTALGQIEDLFAEYERLSGEIRAARAQADVEIGGAVTQINELISEIHAVNADIAALGGSDVTGLENRQAALVDELSQYLDIRTQRDHVGRLIIRTTDGQPLLDQQPRTLEYDPARRGDLGTQYEPILLRGPSGTAEALDRHLQSGELKGLLTLRDEELPALALQLGELASGAADAMNAAHNDSSAVPAPSTLTGRNTGLLAGDAHDFSGAATIAITGADGSLVRRLDVDFGAGTISVNGGAPAAIGGATIGDLTAAIDAQLGAAGSASFTNGRLEISASGGNGVATLQDEANPASRGGRGFSHFFGLNDLVESARPGFYETGLTGTDAHGYTAGQTLEFQITGPSGQRVDTISVTVGGTTFNDLVGAINSAASGIGAYGSIGFDGDGQLNLDGVNGYQIELVGDSTSRGGTGLSFSGLFGLTPGIQAARAESFDVAAPIKADNTRLAFAKLDLASGAVGDTVLAVGDNRGGLALQSMLTATRGFDGAGGTQAMQTSLADYSARLSGDVGIRAARAGRAMESAVALAQQATNKRASVEGVNMDEELAQMTMLQQSYNANARLIQAAREMTETLLNMV